MPDPARIDDADDWGSTPAVDPWAGQDTPWQPMPLPLDPPPARTGPPAAPPAAATRPPAAPPNAATRPPAAPPNAANRPPAAPPTAANRPPAPPRPPVRHRPAAPGNAPPRRRRSRRLSLSLLLGVVCCCGLPGYLAWPAARQYPVSAVLPDSVADLDLRDDSSNRAAAARLSRQLPAGDGQRVFAGVYADGYGKQVSLFGTTGLRLRPERDVESELDNLGEEYDITGVSTFDLGETGVHERCGVGRTGGSAVVVCAWADHGSLAAVLMTRRNLEESAQLTGVLRTAVLTRG